MGLFQKQPFTNAQPLYTLSQSKTILIIGLGNPGKEYQNSRHNVGFIAIDEFAAANDFPTWKLNKDLKSQLTMKALGQTKVLLAKPQTFMNESGQAVQAVQHFYKVSNVDTLVIYDELALPYTQLRTRQGGSDAGHNGVKSLITHIGENFGRLRIGIGSNLSTKKEATDFVLTNFNKQESQKLPKILREATTIITEFIFSGRLAVETRNVD